LISNCTTFPRPVGRRVSSAMALGVELLTLHTAGGLAMMNGPHRLPRGGPSFWA